MADGALVPRLCWDASRRANDQRTDCTLKTRAQGDTELYLGRITLTEITMHTHQSQEKPFSSGATRGACCNFRDYDVL